MPDEDSIFSLGVDASTGRPLNDISDEAVKAMTNVGPEPEFATLQERSQTANQAFAVIGEVDPFDLSQSGWGIIFAASVDQRIKEAVAPLVEHRKRAASPFVIYDGDSSFRPGETARQWLTRQKVSLSVVDPALGVPFYLLIVAPPDSISFEDQYVLDIYWGVGRLWFDTPDQFRQYAESVIRYETANAVASTKNVAVFAPEHDFDNATQLFARHVAKPLTGEDGAVSVPLGSRQKFGLQSVLADRATKAALCDVLCGKNQIGSPALLFSGSHGMQFPADDARQAAQQGALVCQDWSGYGAIKPDHWFAASDLPATAKVHGLMHVFFACHGGGCTKFDSFDRLNSQPRQIAAQPFLSKLPSALLAHANGGALAVLAHIERAWAYSFLGEKGGSQTQGFRDVIGRLLRGERIGQATDVFNMRWAALSVELAELQNDSQRGLEISMKALSRMWIARDDARNFMIFGDPAVRIRVEDLPTKTM